jgi:hypothetical protein
VRDIPKQLHYLAVWVYEMTLNFRFPSNLQVVVLTTILVIVGIVVFLAYINAQSVANDKKRIGDVEQIQKALKLYFDENGFYPRSVAGIPQDIDKYLEAWPQAPDKEGNCTEDENRYTYSQRPGTNYQVTFCLGGKAQGLSAGVHRATIRGIE